MITSYGIYIYCAEYTIDHSQEGHELETQLDLHVTTDQLVTLIIPLTS